MQPLILALDQGTTSSRSLIFDRSGSIVAQAQRELPQIFPCPGHVEHDPELIWQTQLETARLAIASVANGPNAIEAIGITNQRETTILWDRVTGRPIANAFVWQSRISSEICLRLKERGLNELVREKTGLLIDPYFSATKIMYLLEQDDALRRRAEAGEILFGTVDSFLIWRLTGGAVHVTDVSNASRTMLLNIHQLQWDDELLKHCNIPRAMLPALAPTSGLLGTTQKQWLGKSLPILAAAGDQQAATFGQACFQPGDTKNTYGTGCFLIMNTGQTAVASSHGLLTTVGWQIDGQCTYCLEGSVFVAGALIQWLRDQLGMIKSASEIESLAASVGDAAGVTIVPALAGLGAPYWNPDARGSISGLTRGTTKAHIARAALDAIALQNVDLFLTMQQDAQVAHCQLRVDGGASQNDLLMQIQSDLLGGPVNRPKMIESTAWGVASIAGLACGIWANQQEIADLRQLDREFLPTITETQRAQRLQVWRAAVNLVCGVGDRDSS
jgi:glycerol kinase